MKTTQKTDQRITIDGIELGAEDVQFLSCRTYVREEFSEPIPESRDTLRDAEFQTCLQCGTCVATCSLSSLMDRPPRNLFLALTLGQFDEVLASNTLWLCLSCYQCTSRCPRGLKITDIIAALREAVTRAQARLEEEARQETYYAAVRQDDVGQSPVPNEIVGRPDSEQRILEELRSLHLEAKEQLLRYRKMVQKAKRSGKLKEVVAYFDTCLSRYRTTPWYEEMCRIRDELLDWRDRANP